MANRARSRRRRERAWDNPRTARIGWSPAKILLGAIPLSLIAVLVWDRMGDNRVGLDQKIDDAVNPIWITPGKMNAYWDALVQLVAERRASGTAVRVTDFDPTEQVDYILPYRTPEAPDLEDDAAQRAAGCSFAELVAEIDRCRLNDYTRYSSLHPDLKRLRARLAPIADE